MLKILVVTNMFPQPERPGYGTFVKQQVEALERLGHSVDVIYIAGYKSRFRYLTAAVSVLQKTLQKSYDVVHAHYGLSAFPARFAWRTPVVVTLHGSDVLGRRSSRLLSRLICYFLDAVIVVSDQVAKVIPGEVVPCGVDRRVFCPSDPVKARERLGLPQDRPLVLFPFDPRRAVKRFDIAEEAVKKLRERNVDVELLVVFEAVNSDMPFYYSAANVMILCSDTEGSPTSVKEALACNLPVVCSDVGDVREIVAGVAGAEICEQTADAFADALERVIRGNVKEVFRGREAMARYDQEGVARRLELVYGSVK